MAEKINVKAVYDTCRQITRQIENVFASENNEKKEVDPNLLSTLSGAFEEILKYLRFYLIQCQDKFYGCVLMDLDMAIDFKQRGAVDLKIDTSPYTISVNPLFCVDYKFAEFTGLIVNEINKMVWLHPATYVETNPEKDQEKHEYLDKASDAASSALVKSDIYLAPQQSDYSKYSNGVRLPDDVYTQTKLNKECGINSADKQTLSYYYNILRRFKKNPPSGSGGDGDENQNASSSQLPANGQNNNGNNNGIATRNNSQGNPTHQWEGADEDEVKETVNSIVSNVMNSMDDRSRGYMPAELLSQIKKMLEPPEIDWKGILRKMVGSVPVPYRKTRTRLNRRLPYRPDLSGQLPKRIVNVVCCFDTSGSMSDEDLKYCMNEVFNIVKVYEGYKITVVECDADIQRVYQAKRMEDLQLKMKGRGGTSYVPAIEFINGEGEFAKNKNNTSNIMYSLAGTFKDALMIYFTDGYGDSEIPKPRTYRNLWVVLKDVKNLSVAEPYGDVKSLMMDEKWKKMKGRN